MRDLPVIRLSLYRFRMQVPAHASNNVGDDSRRLRRISLRLAIRDIAGSTAAPAASCRNWRRLISIAPSRSWPLSAKAVADADMF
jgi:hypothetical protein